MRKIVFNRRIHSSVTGVKWGLAPPPRTLAHPYFIWSSSRNFPVNDWKWRQNPVKNPVTWPYKVRGPNERTEFFYVVHRCNMLACTISHYPTNADVNPYPIPVMCTGNGSIWESYTGVLCWNAALFISPLTSHGHVMGIFIGNWWEFSKIPYIFWNPINFL